METTNLFEALADSAVLLDKNGRVLNWNSASSSLFGYSKKEVLGWSINFIYAHDFPFPKLIQDLPHKRWQEETVFVRKNGIKGTCRSHLVAISSPEHSKLSALLIHHNVSTYKKKRRRFTKK